MFGHTRKAGGKQEGGKDRGFPPGGRDGAPAGSRHKENDGLTPEPEDLDFGWDEGDPADRRRDPLRKP